MTSLFSTFFGRSACTDWINVFSRARSTSPVSVTTPSFTEAFTDGKSFVTAMIILVKESSALMTTGAGGGATGAGAGTAVGVTTSGFVLDLQESIDVPAAASPIDKKQTRKNCADMVIGLMIR